MGNADFFISFWWIVIVHYIYNIQYLSPAGYLTPPSPFSFLGNGFSENLHILRDFAPYQGCRPASPQENPKLQTCKPGVKYPRYSQATYPLPSILNTSNLQTRCEIPPILPTHLPIVKYTLRSHPANPVWTPNTPNPHALFQFPPMLPIHLPRLSDSLCCLGRADKAPWQIPISRKF